MKSKILLLALLIVYSCICHGQINKWEKLNINLTEKIKAADSIVLFKFNSDNLCDQSKAVSIIKNNEISKCFDYIKTIKGKAVSNFINLLHTKTTYGGGNVACFDTDYSVILIKNNSIIAYINISISCNKLFANPKIQEQESHYKNEGVGSIGFSTSGREQLLNSLGIQ